MDAYADFFPDGAIDLVSGPLVREPSVAARESLDDLVT